ncbi:MAG: hypothetical protein L6R39_005126 [Caloplaca ligustica]|nr:MAG: hypothetical protein L6R39_005126 [Caloplaca ligustica]
MRPTFSVVGLTLVAAASCLNARPAPANDQISGLGPFLSQGANISYDGASNQRWSDYHPPVAAAIVNVATEDDVKYCKAKKIEFLAQNGAHGWSTFNLAPGGLIINLRGLNKVTFNPARTQATIGGGTLISEAIEAAYNNNAQITTGNCNCVGTLGAILGGGYGNLMGLNGFGVDTLLSLTYVNAEGKIVTIGPRDTDLWWALRGAGPNFGIVTHAVVGSKYVAQADSKAWLGALIFTGDKLEGLVSAINDLKLEPEMNIFLYFVVNKGTPVILITPFYYGDEATARQKFSTILAQGPVADMTAITQYNHWNDGAAGFCIKGGRKPSYGAGMLQLKPKVWRAVWTEFVEFTANPGTENSVILMEAYSLGKGRSLPDDSSAFPFRQVTFNAAAIPWYSDPKLDPIADAYGKKVRGIWWANDDLSPNVSYINFAHGDEDLEVVYGSHVKRLQALKKTFDPQNVFDQWFPLTPG